MQFLFLDETTSEPVKRLGRIVALTGVVLPVSGYTLARSHFYDSFRERRTEGGLTVDLAPTELHGRKLLPDATDDEKIAALDKVADLVLEHGFGIYRFGYVESKHLRRFFNSDDVAYALSWADMVSGVQPELQAGALIPVADTGNPHLAEHMSRYIKNLDVLRAAGFGRSLSIDATENIIGEVFFGHSEYSVFVQVADIVSYLLLQRDMRRVGWPISQFKGRVLAVADRLVPAIRAERVANAHMQGSAMIIGELAPPSS
jgi:hypothetical protein